MLDGALSHNHDLRDLYSVYYNVKKIDGVPTDYMFPQIVLKLSSQKN